MTDQPRILTEPQRVTWTQAVCDQCWHVRHPARPIPIRIRTEIRVREQCCDCGMPTMSGIYIRQDPWTVRYPRRLDKDDA